MTPAVPVIDLGGFAGGPDARRRENADEIGEACRAVGFSITGSWSPSADMASRG
ncbi:hypothetical protein [Ilumatobacter sp.]|uniref:hypothetical protein n=1 Tax=Ilumatobacter sp. TaxID=1967498 RepID=UPI003C399898